MMKGTPLTTYDSAFWATPENLPTIYRKPRSCTWNILLLLQKSLDHARMFAIYSPVRCAFPYTETERRFTANGAFLE